MRTDQLISALANDHASQRRLRKPIWYALGVAIVIGFAISAILLAVVLGVRPDIASALGEWRVDMKFANSLILAVVAAWVASRLSRPTTNPRTVGPAFAAPALLLSVAVILELAATPISTWVQRALGMNGLMCLSNIILLSIAPLGAILFALQRGAPVSPSFAGAAAGLLAGALGAAVYATHCMDDSPLFVAVWYTLAIGFVALVGLLVGQYLLRW